MSILIIETGLGKYKSKQAIKVERETPCFWFCFPYKIRKETKKGTLGGCRVKRIFNI